MEKKHGPWIIKETVLKYKNPWIEVRENQVTRPEGNAGIFEMITDISQTLPHQSSRVEEFPSMFQFSIHCAREQEFQQLQ